MVFRQVYQDPDAIFTDGDLLSNTGDWVDVVPVLRYATLPTHISALVSWPLQNN